MMSTLSLFSSAGVTMKDMFTSMPDSLIPYLSKNNRLDCIDFKISCMEAVVKNNFEENSTLDTLTNDYLLMDLNESAQLEMKLLPSAVPGDSSFVLCQIITVKAPEAESHISFYTVDWKELDGKDLLIVPSFDAFWTKPDTMTTERFNTLRKYVDPMMVSASLSSHDNSITFTLAKPLLSNEEKKQLEGVCLQKKLFWNGKIFK